MPLLHLLDAIMAITPDNEWKKEYKHRIKCNRKI